MSDLIDRQTAIEELDRGAWGVEWDKALAKAMLESLPSVQSEIIRCKDCKYWERKSICDGYCDEMSIYGCDEDFYCGYAERRADG